MDSIYVAIIGPADPSEAIAAIAEEAAALVAAAGGIVVTGGRGGVMEAASRGAKSAGGTTVGLLPGLSRHDANPHVDIALPTGMGEMRNMLVVRSADAVIAIGKGYGTLSEIGFALRQEKPVIGIQTWEFHLEGASGGIVQASSAGQAVELLQKGLSGRSR